MRRRCRWPTRPRSRNSSPTSTATHSRRPSLLNGKKWRVKATCQPQDCTTVSSPTRIPNEEIDMSGAGFHVHGPHDHELEHAAQHAGHGEAAHDGLGGGGMINQIAMFTAV